MEVPEFNPKGKETINQYVRRVEKFKAAILKEKYDIILKFVNEWLNSESGPLGVDSDFNSLSEFTNVKEVVLLKDVTHNSKIVNKYEKILLDKFQIDISITNKDFLNENNKDKHIIFTLIKMLNIIDYVLIKREFKGAFIYSIRQS
jgi:hypothetical protein